jgi:hypothetical protein
MFPSMHASVGQNRGWMLFAPRERMEGSCKMPNAKCKLQNGNIVSPLPVPPSPFRLGISLVEVLIAMGILTIGLLGVAALFPVGAFYMHKGDVADKGSAVAQAAFNEAVARGWLNPENWLVWHDTVIGQGGGVVIPATARTFTFTRPFADMLRQKKAVQVASTTLSPTEKQQEIAREFGSVFVIDPAGVASISEYDPGSGAYNPSNAVWPGGNFSSASPAIATAGSAEWKTWVDPLAPFNTKLGTQWPIRRVTLSGVPSGSAQATLFNRLFSSVDDLAMDLPAARDKPAIQRLEMSSEDLNNDGNFRNDALARQSRGDYSWIVTVSPTTAQARDALATDPSAESYEVSVVVYYKRPLGVSSPKDGDERTANFDLLRQNERSVRARIVSTGISGGEVLLEKYYGDSLTESPFANLKTGHWVLLCGPHPNSTDERPMMIARWYRVLAIDKEANGIIDDQENQRLVSLRGPQWPWLPANALSDATLSNALYVCIPAGAVAVHSKTIHLGGDSVWDGGASGLTAPPPPGPNYSP